MRRSSNIQPPLWIPEKQHQSGSVGSRTSREGPRAAISRTAGTGNTCQLLSAMIYSHALTDIGRKRHSNQDQFLIAQIASPVKLLFASAPCQEVADATPTGELLIVADGMGGHRGGEVASQIAVECIYRYAVRHWVDFVAPSVLPGHSIREHLSAAFFEAHHQLMTMSRQSPELEGMGTTLTVAFILWPKLYVGHAGDSRCYLLRAHQLQQITTDQTMEDLVIKDPAQKDLLSTESTPLTHILYNCLGGDVNNLSVEYYERSLEGNDCVLLCTDGLTRHASPPELVQIVKSTPSSILACRQLVETANRAGGTDNITAILARHIPDHSHTSAPRSTDQSARRFPLWDPSADTDPSLSSSPQVWGRSTGRTSS